MAYSYCGTLYSDEKEQITIIYDNMDESPEHNFEWRNPDAKGLLPDCFHLYKVQKQAEQTGGGRSQKSAYLRGWGDWQGHKEDYGMIRMCSVLTWLVCSLCWAFTELGTFYSVHYSSLKSLMNDPMYDHGKGVPESVWGQCAGGCCQEGPWGEQGSMA